MSPWAPVGAKRHIEYSSQNQLEKKDRWIHQIIEPGSSKKMKLNEKINISNGLLLRTIKIVSFKDESLTW